MENGDLRSALHGSLIVLEGLDRSGKTSQSSRLVSFLKEKQVSIEAWRFPDRSTCIGQMISAYLANEKQLDDRAIHLLFSANRWEKRVQMESKLRSGTSLAVDRYSYSGVAFSSAKGLYIDWCKAPKVGLIASDLVLYLDVPLEKAAEREGYGSERYEQLEFQRKVAQNYSMLHDATYEGCCGAIAPCVSHFGASNYGGMDRLVKEFHYDFLAIIQGLARMVKLLLIDCRHTQ